jgi:hypothetical protein
LRFGTSRYYSRFRPASWRHVKSKSKPVCRYVSNHVDLHLPIYVWTGRRKRRTAARDPAMFDSERFSVLGYLRRPVRPSPSQSTRAQGRQMGRNRRRRKEGGTCHAMLCHAMPCNHKTAAYLPKQLGSAVRMGHGGEDLSER